MIVSINSIARTGKIWRVDTHWTTCSTAEKNSPSIPLSFNLAIVLPRRSVYAFAMDIKYYLHPTLIGQGVDYKGIESFLISTL